MGTLSSTLALFFGSFLLFGIQPMLGRALLPSFGGSAAVWTVCLAAYQVLLLFGYGYAHLLAGRSARTQRRLHIALLGVAVLWTLAFAALRLTLRSRLGDFPVPSLEVLGCVLVFAGLPYVLLSANSTLIQAWLARATHAQGGVVESESERHASRAVYKLYAVSNLGSLLGLLVYPFILEPFVSLNAQWYGFAACLLIYTILLAVVARNTQSPGGEVHGSRFSGCEGEPSDLRPPTSDLPAALTRPWLWFALPALSTFLLNAVTAHLSTDVTPVPMMWVLLLTAFLLSYVIGFSKAGEGGLIVWAIVAVLVLAAAAGVSGMTGGGGFLPNLICGVLTVLLGCTFLHAWLYRVRPHAAQLTHFYLGIAAGGAAGGVCASLVAPVLFSRVWEYPLGLIGLCAACAWLIRTWDHAELKGLNRFLLGVAAVTVLWTVNAALKSSANVVLRQRNFYGCLRVERERRESSLGESVVLASLIHGETLHGLQAQDRFNRRKPTTYFAEGGGGLSFTSHPKYADHTQPMNVGIIGLGAGTLACYGRTNDLYRFIEINPQVIAIASDTNYFSFVADCAARVDLVQADARKQLEKERAAQAPLYDVLVVDAYSGDSVPSHLATREAFQLYVDRLAPDGILAIHISNWNIDLAPLCKAAAADFNLQLSGVISPQTPLATVAHWVFLTHAPLPIGHDGCRRIDWAQVLNVRLPTDERGSLLSLIRFGIVPPSRLELVNLNL